MQSLDLSACSVLQTLNLGAYDIHLDALVLTLETVIKNCASLHRLWLSVKVRQFARRVMTDEAMKKFDALDRVLHDIGSKANACTITVHLVFDPNLVWEQNLYKDGTEYATWVRGLCRRVAGFSEEKFSLKMCHKILM